MYYFEPYTVTSISPHIKFHCSSLLKQILPSLPSIIPPLCPACIHTNIFVPLMPQPKHDLYVQASHHLVREVDK